MHTPSRENSQSVGLRSKTHVASFSKKGEHRELSHKKNGVSSHKKMGLVFRVGLGRRVRLEPECRCAHAAVEHVTCEKSDEGWKVRNDKT